MREWFRKHFGQPHLPSLASGAGSLVGSVLGAAGGPEMIIAGGVAGILVGHLSGTALAPFFTRIRSVRSLVKSKLNMDFDRSALHQQLAVEAAAEECNERLQELETQGEVHVDGRTPPDELPFVPNRKHQIHPTLSTTTEDQTLLDFAKTLRAAYPDNSDPIIMNCSCINVAGVAVTKSLVQHYGLNIRIDYDDVAGRYQIRTLDRDDDERIDFVIAAQSPFFLSGADRTRKYRRMFPINSEDQRVLTKKGSNQRGSGEVSVFHRSSALEQALLGVGVPKNAKLSQYPRIEELPSIIDAMRPGDEIVLWEPLVSGIGRRSNLQISDRVFPIWICMFCHQRWRASAKRSLKSKFTSLFIDEWNYCRRNRAWALSLLLGDKAYIESFATGAGVSGAAKTS